MSSTQTRELNLPYFDFWRFASSEAVVIGHALNIFVPSVFMSRKINGDFEASRPILYVQNIGVVVFFALSGFLVTRAAQRRWTRPKYGLGGFLIDRATRIFVPFLPAILLITVADYMIFGAASKNPFTTIILAPWTLIANALMLFNNPVFSVMAKLLGRPELAAGAIGTAAQLWTVTIEWWIYVAFGVLLFQRGRRTSYGIVYVLVVVFAVGPMIASLSTGSGLVLAWPIGMCIAFADRQFRQLDIKTLRAICGLCLFSAIFCLARNHWSVYQPAVVVTLSASLLLGAYLFSPSRETQNKPVSPMGRIGVRLVAAASDYSYSLYLVHFSILIYLQHFEPASLAPFPAVVLAVVVSNLVAGAFWWCFERHYLLIRERMMKAFGREGAFCSESSNHPAKPVG